MTQEPGRGKPLDPESSERPGPGRGGPGGDTHDMGGEIGPASMRGSQAPAEGRPGDEAAPKSGYGRPVSSAADDISPYITGRDDLTPATAGSDEAAVAARTGSEGVEKDLERARGKDPTGYAGEPESDVAGRGAEGDREARARQKREGGP